MTLHRERAACARGKEAGLRHWTDSIKVKPRMLPATLITLRVGYRPILQPSVESPLASHVPPPALAAKNPGLPRNLRRGLLPKTYTTMPIPMPVLFATI